MEIIRLTGLSAITHTVVRIRGEKKCSNSQFSGTGFFYSFQESGKLVPLIISNKHVLCNSKFLQFDFAVADVQHQRMAAPAETVQINEGQLPIYSHPDPDVDLAAIPLAPILRETTQSGREIYNVLLNEENFPSEDNASNLKISTNVIMIGYPNGLMDDYNNLPISRRGFLATEYIQDYQGKSDFVVDIAAFGGSSGSPVFSISDQIVADQNGNPVFLREPIISLIGVLRAGPIMKEYGEIISVEEPTNFLVSETNTMINLGICLKYSRIKELCSHIEKNMS